MGFLSSIDPLVFLVAVAIAPVSRLISLVITLRGAAPGERPAIIRALADFFRVLPTRRR
ncbi:hypothetical protein ABZU86_13500 [Streptomyces sp. NPDC005271]|uniref:hypothetical protein n=1 Tax=unclassified Streptomyces TaxID=2593676 RepID=UPI0033BE5201